MGSTSFCPNCGNKIVTDEAFCGECGFNVKKFLAEQVKSVTNETYPEDIHTEVKSESVDDSVSKPVGSNLSDNLSETTFEDENVRNYQETTQVSQPASNYQSTADNQMSKPRKKSKKAPILITALLLAVVIGGGYFVGTTHYSRASQVTALKDEVTSGKTSKMRAALVDANGKPLSNSQIDALKRLYLSSPDATKKIEQEIDGRSKDIFTVTTSGKIFGLFDQYKVQVTPKILFIDTNIENPAFYLNGKSIAATHTSGEYRISDLTPGVYDLRIKGADDSKTEQVKITPFRKDDTTQLLVEKKSVDNSEDYSDSETSTDQVNFEDERPARTTPAPEPARRPTPSTTNSMYGTYHGSPDLTLNSDGTYTLGSKSGTYSMSQNGSSVSITYYQNGGGSITESYDYDGSELYSDKYGQGWIKE
ncbi:zinc ribbon domain-containing protein [Companilactobacillus zhongbaensis]|uniref:zinc ribbon domain-containing protein n=1 Tax=Companilactobacillus zhongbaensis TaxID=2486009 RepID=UPI000F7ADD6D|nr:zinc ribbon domain-containing protein [Companilactobacillus zhongbaensis]